jgi:hypothetical protein
VRAGNDVGLVVRGLLAAGLLLRARLGTLARRGDVGVRALVDARGLRAGLGAAACVLGALGADDVGSLRGLVGGVDALGGRAARLVRGGGVTRGSLDGGVVLGLGGRLLLGAALSLTLGRGLGAFGATARGSVGLAGRRLVVLRRGRFLGHRVSISIGSGFWA